MPNNIPGDFAFFVRSSVGIKRLFKIFYRTPIIPDVRYCSIAGKVASLHRPKSKELREAIQTPDKTRFVSEYKKMLLGIMEKRTRTLFAWVLLATLMPFWGVKVLHWHEGNTCHDVPYSHEKGHHPCEDCGICQFTLSTFIETEKNTSQPILTWTLCDSLVYEEADILIITHRLSLRAPPLFC